MDVYQAMRSRRSIRDFRREEIPEGALRRVLEAAFLAPSGADAHPYIFILVDRPELRKEIQRRCEEADRRFHNASPSWFKEWMQKRDISHEKTFLVDAPALVVVAGETDMPYWLESTWIAIGYLILAAEREGLASLTYTPAETDFFHPLLNLHDRHRVTAVIPIGYPRDTADREKSASGVAIYRNRLPDRSP